VGVDVERVEEVLATEVLSTERAEVVEGGLERAGETGRALTCADEIICADGRMMFSDDATRGVGVVGSLSGSLVIWRSGEEMGKVSSGMSASSV